MSIDERSLQRSLSALTIGVAKGYAEREAGLVDDRLQEIDQQFQLPIVGEAGAIVAVGYVDVPFRHYFISAPAQRDSQLEEPHFTYGSVLRTDVPVMISASVVKWDDDNDRGEFRGARVGISVAMPEVSFGSLNTDLVVYDGYLHCTFQGYAYTPQADPSQDF